MDILLPIPYHPIAVEIEDLDNDGLKDLIALSDFSERITWQKNLGNNQYADQIVIFNNVKMNGLTDLDIFDIDGDSDLDIITCKKNGTGSYSLVWLKNNGNAVFDNEVVLSTNNYSYVDFIFSDFDLDGDSDIIAATTSSSSIKPSLLTIENLGNGNLAPLKELKTSLPYVMNISVSDINNDGKPDIIASSNTSINWFENLDSLNFNQEVPIDSNLTTIRSLKTADINGDGYNDIVFGSYDLDQIIWIKNKGNDTFDSTQIISSSTDGVVSIALGDYDGDGDQDLFSSSLYDDDISKFENLGSGNFGSKIVISSNNNNPRQIKLTQMDSDTLIDLVSVCFDDSKIAWYKNIGNGSFGTEQCIISAPYAPRQIEYKDIDGDLKKDIVVSTSLSEKLIWYKNLGEMKFRSERTIINSNIPTYLLLDINNDKRLDVLYLEYDYNNLIYNLSWLENLGQGQFNSPIHISNSIHQLFKATDLDNDGDLDLIAADINKHLGWFENLGNSTFGNHQLFDLSGLKDFPSIVISNDIDKDGDIDVIISSSGLRNTSWYENLGNGIFDTKSTISNYFSDHMLVADLDNNGQNEIIGSTNDNKSMTRLEYSNNSFISKSNQSNYPSYIRNFDLRDQDDDGDIDIVYGARSPIKLEIINNDGSGKFNPPLTLDHKSIAWEVFFSDLDNDKDYDVFASIQNMIVRFDNRLYNDTQVRGQVYYDQNGNGIRDSFEIGLNRKIINAKPSNDFSFSRADGRYFLSFSDVVGTYSIKPKAIDYWTITSSPKSFNVTINSNFTSKDSIDFGLAPDTLFYDANTELVGDFARCNSTVNYWIDYKNTGTVIHSGLAHLTLDDSLQFENSVPRPDSIDNNNFYWRYDSLFFFSGGLIKLQVKMPDFNSIGLNLTSISEIIMKDSLGNYLPGIFDTLNQTLVCAYDPNDKISDPAGYDSLGYVSTSLKEIEYTIRFQNTGNDTAVNVLIKDLLDPNLDFESLTPLVSSHEVDIKVDHHGEVNFYFNSIMLPDSSTSQQNSHGFIKYVIALKPKLSHRTQIKNTANIYFDFNPPITTNSTIHTLYDCVKIYDQLKYQSPICPSDSILANFTPIADSIFIDYSWKYNGNKTHGIELLNTKDTSGIFKTRTSVRTPFCKADSIINFIIIPSLNSIIDQSICLGDSILIGNSYQILPGIYYDSLQSIYGCDSIITTILDTNSNYINYLLPIYICENDSIHIFNKYESKKGFYTDSLQTLNGCDSIQIIELLINDLPTVKINNKTNLTYCNTSGSIKLVSTPSGGDFSGLGVQDNVFYTTDVYPGRHIIYYSFIDLNGCTGFDSISVNIVDCLNTETHSNNQIFIYPNPTKNIINIDLGDTKNVSIKIYNINQQIIYEKSNINSAGLKLDLDLPQGTYFIEAKSTNKVNHFIIVKN